MITRSHFCGPHIYIHSFSRHFPGEDGASCPWFSFRFFSDLFILLEQTKTFLCPYQHSPTLSSSDHVSCVIPSSRSKFYSIWSRLCHLCVPHVNCLSRPIFNTKLNSALLHFSFKVNPWIRLISILDNLTLCFTLFGQGSLPCIRQLLTLWTILQPLYRSTCVSRIPR